MVFHINRSIRPHLSRNIKEWKNKFRPQSIFSTELSVERERDSFRQNIGSVCDKLVSWLLHHLTWQSHQDVCVLQDRSFLLYTWKIFTEKSSGVYKKESSQHCTGTISMFQWSFSCGHLTPAVNQTSALITVLKSFLLNLSLLSTVLSKFWIFAVNNVSMPHEKCFPSKFWFKCCIFLLLQFLP